jgi:hypothetical protein
VNTDFDPQRMIDTAFANFLAAERCGPEATFATYPRHSVNAPQLVLYALSVEIMLKERLKNLPILA